MKTLAISLLRCMLIGCVNLSVQAAGPGLPHPILFVTQVPQPLDFITVAAILTNNRAEIFPEPGRAVQGSGVLAHRFNHFFPWQINEDGTEEETLGHIGRQEIGGTYTQRSFSNDPNLIDLYYFGNKFNTNTLVNFVQPRESPTTAGLYFGVDAPEFDTHSAGQIVALEANVATNANFFRLHYFTHRATANVSANPGPNHTGLYRHPHAGDACRRE